MIKADRAALACVALGLFLALLGLISRCAPAQEAQWHVPSATPTSVTP